MKVVFLDRDGTLNEDLGYVSSWTDWRFTNQAVEALHLLRCEGFRLAVVTNQSGVARGIFTAADVIAIHDALRQELCHRGIPLDAVAFCPHSPDEQCHCRKPNTGLAAQIQQQLGAEIDVGASWTIGDKRSDIEFGHRLGTNTALLRSKYWNNEQLDVAPTLIVDNLYEAARQIAARH